MPAGHAERLAVDEEALPQVEKLRPCIEAHQGTVGPTRAEDDVRLWRRQIAPEEIRDVAARPPDAR
jgi:hypothetical protein